MATALQDDPYAKYGGNIAPSTGDMAQPIASVRTAGNSNVGDSFQMNGQDVYVSGVDSKGRKTLSPGKPPAQAASDPYAKYGGNVAASSGSTADPYAKYNQPQGMSRPEADQFLQNLATHGQGAYQPPKQPSFAGTALVDPNSPVFGEQIKSSIHPDTRGGRNLVPIQDVAATRAQMQQDSANPDQAAAIQRSQQMDTSLPLADRLSNRAGLEVRKRTELGQAVSNANDQWKQFAGSKGADAGEAFAQFMARHFQTENPQATPGEIGAARSIGKNVASTAVDPVTHATILTGGVGGKLAQATVAALFAAGAAKGSYDAAGQLGSIWDRQDVSAQDKAEMASDLVLNTAMAGMAGAHAVKVPFLKTGDPLLSSIPQEYRDAVTQKVNSTLKATGGMLSRAASTAGDVAAEVGNSDRENVPTQSVTALRRAIPKVPAASAETALPLIRAAANDAGFKTIAAADLLDSAPDKDGNTSLGLIGQAKNEVLAQAHAAAGPGRTIADLSPQEMEPYQRMFAALDDVHDHIQQAQEQETAELKKAADRGKIPATKAASLVRMGMGAGKVAVSASAGPALGRMSRVLLSAYGIPSGFNDLVTGVKGLISAGGKLSPTLDENLSAALGRTRPADTGTFGANPDTRAAATPYQGDTTVPHDSLIFPPDTPHGDATMLRDEANPRFQLSSSSTAQPLPSFLRRQPQTIAQPPQLDNGIGSLTAARNGEQVSPQPIQRQLVPSTDSESAPTLPFLRKMKQGQPTTGEGLNPGDYAVPRGQHPESVVERALTHLSLPALREAARAGDIDYGSSDTHQDLIAKIMDAYAGQNEHLSNLAETLQGKRGAVPAGPRERAPIQDEDLTDVMARSVEAAQAKNGQQGQRGILDILRGSSERRQPGNADIRSRFNDMSADQKTQALMEAHQRERTSELTGLPNYTAFKESADEIGDTHPHVGYADVDDFKNVNSALGHKGADAVLSEIGNMFTQAQAEENGAVHSFHRSGDEFLFRASDPETVTRVVDRVNNQLAKTKFTFVDSAGKEVEQRGIGLKHGTGFDEHSAEAAAETDKQLRTQQGKRTGSRDQAEVQPVGTAAPAGANAEVDNLSERQDVSRGTAAQPVRSSSIAPGEEGRVVISDLHVAPKELQYKMGTNEQGVTNLLKDTKTFNPDLAGVLSVWDNPANGKTMVVNGHHRIELAQRTGQDSMLIRKIIANNVKEARATGALINMSEGRGTAIDAAKFIRDSNADPATLEKMGVPMSEGKVQDGMAMSKLSDHIFSKVVSGDVPENFAIEIGNASSDPALQEGTLKLIEQAQQRGKNLSVGTVRELAKDVARTSVRVENTMDLFGGHSKVFSNAIEKAQVREGVAARLAGARRAYGAVSSEGKAKTLGNVEGQNIKASDNAVLHGLFQQAEELLNKEQGYTGPINDLFDNAANDLVHGYGTKKEVVDRAYNKFLDQAEKRIDQGSVAALKGKNLSSFAGAPNEKR